MADNVQFILDKLATTLQRMGALGVFNKEEIQSVVKRTTDYEYVLKRRQLKPADFYEYLKYEINLDKLRALRCAARGARNKEKQDAFRALDGAFLRHISYIFDRAVRRFPGETALWADYISFLRSRNAVSALNAVFGKALSLNPKNEEFWMQAAAHELDANNNVHAARTLLQRSLRANKVSRPLWLKYFELELWNAVRINERQRVLALEVMGQGRDPPIHSRHLPRSPLRSTVDCTSTPQVDTAPVFGAPLVVLKHALRAMPDDVDFACRLHARCAEVSAALATQVPLGVHVCHRLLLLPLDARSFDIRCPVLAARCVP